MWGVEAMGVYGGGSVKDIPAEEPSSAISSENVAVCRDDSLEL
jgi:hypothetical protein